MMRRIVIAASLLVFPALARAASADLGQVRNVYLLPMGSGLDQYLAVHLTAESLYQVVTDPKLADAVITDQIGQGFEQRMLDLYPPEKPPAAEKEEESEEKDKASKKDDEAARAVAGFKLGAAKPTVHVSAFSRGKGNIFLVEVKTRRVLWSAYEPPKRMIPAEMNKTSQKIIERLRRDVKGEVKAK